MATKFNKCPNCDSRPSGGLFGSGWFKVYECEACEKCYCYNCGDGRCPDCGSKKAKVVGAVHS